MKGGKAECGLGREGRERRWERKAKRQFGSGGAK